MRKLLFSTFLIHSVFSFAQEPGFIVSEPKRLSGLIKENKPTHSPNEMVLQTPKNKSQTKSRTPTTNLMQIFDSSRGLTSYEVQTLYIQRKACARLLYSPSGWSLNGDGDLKMTKRSSALFEYEFPSAVYLGDENPYHNGVLRAQSLPQRRLLDLSGWSDGDSLKLRKSVEVEFVDENKPTRIVLAEDEFKVLGDTYPLTLIVRETIHLPKKFTLYYFCQ